MNYLWELWEIWERSPRATCHVPRSRAAARPPPFRFARTRSSSPAAAAPPP